MASTFERKIKDILKKLPPVVRSYRFLLEAKHVFLAGIRGMRGRRSFERMDFEEIYQKSDPWDYAGDHQQERFRLLLQRIPAVNHVLEIGCAEGMFTELLADRVHRVVAMDVSRTALRRARKRCELRGNISFVHADMVRLPFRAEFDAVVCAGILVYLPEKRLMDQVSGRILSMIRMGGYLILENKWTRSGAAIAGEKIHGYFVGMPKLRVNELLLHDEYGISVFRKEESNQ